MRVRRHVCVEPASRLHARTHNAPWLRADEVGQRSKLLEPLRLARTRKKKDNAEPQHVWHFLFSAMGHFKSNPELPFLLHAELPVGVRSAWWKKDREIAGWQDSEIVW